jgi:predicted esterase
MRIAQWLTILLTATFGAAYAPEPGTREAEAFPAASVPAAKPTGVTSVQSGIAFGKTRSGVTLKLNLHTPEIDTTSTAIIWLHGTRPSSPRSRMDYYADHFAQLGYVSATIDYTDDSVHDAQTAIRYFRRHADDLGIDPDRIFIGGYSFGAIVSVDAGENATGAARPDGIISISGYNKFGHPTAASPPLLVLHGDRDPTVPYPLGVNTCNAWKRAGAPCRLVTLKGAAHSAITYSRRNTIWPSTDRWLRSLPGGGGGTGTAGGTGPGGGTTAPSDVPGD